jgi:hypothetical protein
MLKPAFWVHSSESKISEDAVPRITCCVIGRNGRRDIDLLDYLSREDFEQVRLIAIRTVDELSEHDALQDKIVDQVKNALESARPLTIKDDRADRPENAQDANLDGSDVSATASTVAVAAVAAAVTSSEVNASMNIEASSPAPAAPVFVAEVSPTPVFVAPATTVSVEAPVATPTPAPAPLPKVEFQPLKTSELTSVIESAGMVWVNTDHQKLEEVRGQIAAEPVIAHPPREPKPPVEASTGPMVLVETGGKEQTIEK